MCERWMRGGREEEWGGVAGGRGGRGGRSGRKGEGRVFSVLFKNKHCICILDGNYFSPSFF